MIRYISVDAGKFATKTAEYLPKENCIKRTKFETKTAPGDFRDDAIERETFIAQIGDRTLKIGHGASGEGAELTTSKQSIIHRDCTLAAVAWFCSDNEVDEVYLAVGLPAKEWQVVNKREAYKEFFSVGEQEISIKRSSAADIEKKHFIIKRVYVFPESIGALQMDDSPKYDPNALYGVLDIGNLNLNATLWQGNELIADESVTDELGAASLISGLAQELSAEFTRVNTRLVDSILRKKPDKRMLTGSTEVQEKSKAFIHDYLIGHAEKIKRCCDARKWAMDYMQMVAIGGTSTILRDELAEVFGGRLMFLENPAFANAYGFLRMMCARIPEIGAVIPLTEVSSDKGRII